MKNRKATCKMPAEIEYGEVAAPHEAIMQPIGRCDPIHAPAQELGAVGQWIHEVRRTYGRGMQSPLQPLRRLQPPRALGLLTGGLTYAGCAGHKRSGLEKLPAVCERHAPPILCQGESLSGDVDAALEVSAPPQLRCTPSCGAESRLPRSSRNLTVVKYSIQFPAPIRLLGRGASCNDHHSWSAASPWLHLRLGRSLLPAWRIRTK